MHKKCIVRLTAEVMFSGIDVVRDFAADRKLPEPLDLGAAVLAMAMLGGYFDRKHDGPPGCGSATRD